jgi:hypothetical protein
LNEDTIPIFLDFEARYRTFVTHESKAFLGQLKKPKHKLFKVDCTIEVVQNNDNINCVSLFLAVSDVTAVNVVVALCNVRSRILFFFKV